MPCFKWRGATSDSSPRVTGYEITVNGEEARIAYAMRTSMPAFYETIEIIRFGTEDGRTSSLIIGPRLRIGP
ncbi:hypothetical protein [Paenibacillus sp. 1P07SE]|uniref:hypothetical protein n=1 Tax=Paenibacillus sp. 1P07SE TaxID=3132209 RepID=UPI0039A6CD3B